MFPPRLLSPRRPFSFSFLLFVFFGLFIPNSRFWFLFMLRGLIVSIFSFESQHKTAGHSVECRFIDGVPFCDRFLLFGQGRTGKTARLNRFCQIKGFTGFIKCYTFIQRYFGLDHKLYRHRVSPLSHPFSHVRFG